MRAWLVKRLTSKNLYVMLLLPRLTSHYIHMHQLRQLTVTLRQSIEYTLAQSEDKKSEASCHSLVHF